MQALDDALLKWIKVIIEEQENIRAEEYTYTSSNKYSDALTFQFIEYSLRIKKTNFKTYRLGTLMLSTKYVLIAL